MSARTRQIARIAPTAINTWMECVAITDFTITLQGVLVLLVDQIAIPARTQRVAKYAQLLINFPIRNAVF